MQDEEILSQLQVIFQEVFQDDEIKVNFSTTAEDVNNWDSLSHINLVVSVEKLFDIRLALGEIADLQNVGDFVHVIKNKL